MSTEIIPLKQTDLWQTLMPFQREGVQYAISKRGKVLIGDDMGLGKTLQGLATAYYYRAEWPLLIITPSSLKHTWREAVLRWIPGIQATDVQLVDKASSPVEGLVVIISYTLFHRCSEKILKRNFQVVVCDESHYLKNARAKRTMAIIPVVHQAKRRVMLSGTPALSRPCEMFWQLHAIRPDVFDDFHKFGLSFCDAKLTRFGWDYTGSSNLLYLAEKLREFCMIRRQKLDVLTQLPPKVRQRIALNVDTSEISHDKMQEFRDSVKLRNHPSERIAMQAKRDCERLVMELYAEIGRIKENAVCEYVHEFLDSTSEKFLVFCHHQTMMNRLCAELTTAKVRHIRIDGGVSAQHRFDQVKQFQEDPDTRVAVLSITAAGVGLTLTAASIVMFAEMYWVPGALQQAEDRVHRYGQVHTCHIIYMIVPNSIDEMVWNTVNRKQGILGKMLDGNISASLHAEFTDDMETWVESIKNGSTSSTQSGTAE